MSLSNDDGDELPDDKSVSSGDGLSGDDESLLMSDSEGTILRDTWYHTHTSCETSPLLSYPDSAHLRPHSNAKIYTMFILCSYCCYVHTIQNEVFKLISPWPLSERELQIWHMYKVNFFT